MCSSQATTGSQTTIETFKNKNTQLFFLVLGQVNADQLGIALTHEHLSKVHWAWWQEPQTEREKTKSYLPWTLENVHWIRQYPYHF